MPDRPTAPSPANEWLITHAHLLSRSYLRLTGRHLIDAALPPVEAARALWEAPFVVVSHDTQADPVFTYGNAAALKLFEMTWEEFTQLPSRLSAEPPNQDERARLLAEVTARGFIDDYSGVRTAKSGHRFVIEQATVWNLVDEEGGRCGQAATFGRWRDLG